MKKQVIVYASGENSGTYSFLCFAENFTGNIDEKTDRFVSWDCNIYTSVDMYRVREIDIPAWMGEEEYKRENISLKYVLTLTGIDPDTMTKQMYDKVKQLPETWQYFIGWILSKKSKNNFIQSIQEQVRTWMNESESKYNKPLSIAQWEAATKYCPLYEAKQITNRLYYSQ